MIQVWISIRMLWCLSDMSLAGSRSASGAKPNKQARPLPGCGQAACDKSSMSPVHELRQNGFPETNHRVRDVSGCRHSKVLVTAQCERHECHNIPCQYAKLIGTSLLMLVRSFWTSGVPPRQFVEGSKPRKALGAFKGASSAQMGMAAQSVPYQSSITRSHC